MPIVESSYQAPLWIRQMDFMTIYSAKLRQVQGVRYMRERVELPDGDFIDLDWSKTMSFTYKCILMLHGLEGSSKSQYMQGVAKKFNQAGFDVCAMNFRSCSGEPNRKYICYHSGKTDDVAYIIQHILSTQNYKQLVLHGVSLGANVALKLAGENKSLPHELKVIIAVSAPIDLSGSSANLNRKRNVLYAQNFLRHLKSKITYKQKQFPGKISLEVISNIKTIKEFDDLYTAPAHGFKDAEDYYAQNSSLQFLKHIEIPTLILNAQNDSFISADSYPYHIAKVHPYLYLETPKYGGHVAFLQRGEFTYNEERALEFVSKYMA